MPLLTREPSGTAESLEELFAIAAAMREATVDGYARLADRMREERRPDLVAVFDRLAAGESGELAAIQNRAKAATGREPDASAMRWDIGSAFDDEGTGSAASELLSAYRALSMAVRNAERAFSFWSYLAASSTSPETQKAAEQMALGQLDQIAALRRERRLAFHAERAQADSSAGSWTAAELEARLAELLEAAAEADPELRRLAAEARVRAEALRTDPPGESPLLRYVAPEASGRLQPCAELLLECYLDFAERLPTQEGRNRCQSFAAQILACLGAARAIEATTGPSL